MPSTTPGTPLCGLCHRRPVRRPDRPNCQPCFNNLHSERRYSGGVERRTTCRACPLELTGQQRLWCSDYCRVAFARRDRERSEPPPSLDCGECGLPVARLEHLTRYHPDCSARRRSRRYAERLAALRAERAEQTPRSPRPCEHCGAVFTPAVTGPVRRLCGPRCRAAASRARRVVSLVVTT